MMPYTAANPFCFLSFMYVIDCAKVCRGLDLRRPYVDVERELVLVYLSENWVRKILRPNNCGAYFFRDPGWPQDLALA